MVHHNNYPIIALAIIIIQKFGSLKNLIRLCRAMCLEKSYYFHIDHDSIRDNCQDKISANLCLGK